MIKRVLVALDPDSDTAVAIRYAAAIAERYGAEIDGLAVIDLGGIEAGTKGGGIGSLFYAEKLRERLTDETRSRAERLIAKFEELVSAEGLAHGEIVREGVPFRRIAEEAKYADLLVIGKQPHFFYGHPDQKTRTVAGVVRHTVAPTLVVSDTYRPVNKVLVAYDGSDASACAMQSFAWTRPFGEVAVDLMHVYEHDGEIESELLLSLGAGYLGAHGFDVNPVSIRGDHVSEAVLDHATAAGVDLIVAGSDNASGLKRLALGSTTERLIEGCDLPLMLDR